MPPALDLRGLHGPLLWTRVKLALEKIGYGDTLAILIDDPAALRELPQAAQREGHRVVDVQVDSEGFSITLERRAQQFARTFLDRT